MFLLQIAQAPIVFHVANEKGQPEYEVHVSKYTLEDAITWGATLLERYREAQKADLDPVQQREWDAMYPPIPPTLADLKRSCASLEGAREIIQTCMPKAKVFGVKAGTKGKGTDGKRFWHKGVECTSPELVSTLTRQLLTGNGAGSLTALAWKLADLVDTSGHEVPPQKDESDEEGRENPLADTETPD